MLRQEDFIAMLGSMVVHVERTIRITEELIVDMDSKELRFKLVALRQAKFVHLETLDALQTLIKANLAHAIAVDEASGGTRSV